MSDTDIFRLVAEREYETLLDLVRSTPHLLSLRHSHQYTILHSAAEAAPAEVVEQIINLGADVHAIDDEIETPIFWAAEGSNCEVVDVLLSHGASLDAMNRSGHTPLHTVILDGNEEMVEFLVSRGVSIHQRTGYKGATALHLAVIALDKKLVEYLVQKGIDINIRDDKGETPLHYAIMTNTVHRRSVVSAMECLIRLGADINAKSDEGETPWSYARRYTVNDYLKVLEKYGSEV